MEVVVTTGTIRHAKLSEIVTTNKSTPNFYSSDTLAQPTLSKH